MAVEAELPNGDLQLHFKRAWSDGTTGIRLTFLELLERLCALVPPPKKNQVTYFGVLARRSKLRQHVVPTMRARAAAPKLTRQPGPAASRWVPWAELLMRVFVPKGRLRVPLLWQ